MITTLIGQLADRCCMPESRISALYDFACASGALSDDEFNAVTAVLNNEERQLVGEIMIGIGREVAAELDVLVASSSAN